MLKEDKRFEESTVFEGITSIRSLLYGVDNGYNDRKIERLLMTENHKAKNPKEAAWLSHEAERRDFAVETVTDEYLDGITVGSSHGGLAAICGKRTIPDLLSADVVLPKDGFFAMIQGIEDPYNFGYAIRSLYATGVTGIILSERNWLTAAGVVSRSSAGASEMLPIYTADSVAAVDFFHENRYSIVCADLRTEIELSSCTLKKPILLIVGGEKRGISRALLDKADIIVKIPYGREFDAALSAASATTILAWEIFRQTSK